MSEPPRLQLSLMQTQLSQCGSLPHTHFLYLALREAEREKPLPRRRLHAQDVICSHTNMQMHTPVYPLHAMSSMYYGIPRWHQCSFQSLNRLGIHLNPLKHAERYSSTTNQEINSVTGPQPEHSIHINIWWRQFKEKEMLFKFHVVFGECFVTAAAGRKATKHYFMMHSVRNGNKLSAFLWLFHAPFYIYSIQKASTIFWYGWCFQTV